LQAGFCVRIGDVEMGGDRGMNLFQILYLRIPSYPHISLLTLFSPEIHHTCKSRTLSSAESLDKPAFFWFNLLCRRPHISVSGGDNMEYGREPDSYDLRDNLSYLRRKMISAAEDSCKDSGELEAYIEKLDSMMRW
jgi:hypothetical protein